MKRVLIAALCCFLTMPALAQKTRMKIGDVDSRQSPLESEALLNMFAEQGGKTAHCAAMYGMEKEDHAEDKKTLDDNTKALNDLRAWVSAYFGG